MTRTNKILISVVALGLAVCAYYFLVLAPKREEVAKLDTQGRHQAGRGRPGAADARHLRGGAQELQAQLRPARPPRQGRAGRTTTSARCSSSSRPRPTAAASTSRRSSSAAASPARRGARRQAGRPHHGELASAPGAVPVAGGALSAMPFNFSFTGGYFDLSSFFARLEHFVTVNNQRIAVTGRLMRLESVSITPAPPGSRRCRPQIGAATYLVPPSRLSRAPPDRRRPGRHDAGYADDPGHDPAHDHRERRSRTMNAVTSIWRQMMRRRLWPLAVLLVAALVAVPVLLARDAEPVAAPVEPAPAVTAKADDTIAEPVVAKAEAADRGRRRRVLGARKDPFQPPPSRSRRRRPRRPTPRPTSRPTGHGHGHGRRRRSDRAIRTASRRPSRRSIRPAPW